EVVVVTIFHIEMETGSGDLYICLPYSMVEPIRELLDAGVQSDRGERDERWEHALRDEILAAKVELSSYMAETQLSMKELASLKVGDIIPADIPEMVGVYAAEVPIFKGQLGVSEGNFAVKVQEWSRKPKRPGLQELLTRSEN
ncbi:MAG: FliM/FliN family flagellar motor switch protein, partial [Candidatus Sedimenticola sp. 6PFRAG1]